MKIGNYKNQEEVEKAFKETKAADRRRFVGAVIQAGGDPAVWIKRVVQKNREGATAADAKNTKISSPVQTK